MSFTFHDSWLCSCEKCGGVARRLMVVMDAETDGLEIINSSDRRLVLGRRSYLEDWKVVGRIMHLCLRCFDEVNL